MAAASSAATRDRWILAGPRDRRLTPEPRGRPRDRPVPRLTATAGAGTGATANLHIHEVFTRNNLQHAVSFTADRNYVTQLVSKYAQVTSSYNISPQVKSLQKLHCQRRLFSFSCL